MCDFRGGSYRASAHATPAPRGPYIVSPHPTLRSLRSLMWGYRNGIPTGMHPTVELYEISHNGLEGNTFQYYQT